jgi:hypothetical protein
VRVMLAGIVEETGVLAKGPVCTENLIRID